MLLTVWLAIQLKELGLVKGPAAWFMTNKTLRMPVPAQCRRINRQYWQPARDALWRDLLRVAILAKGFAFMLMKTVRKRSITRVTGETGGVE